MRLNYLVKRTIYRATLFSSLAAIPVLIFGIINTMVSLKYETNDSADCISGITGTNLCHTIWHFTALIICCVSCASFLLLFSKKNLQKIRAAHKTTPESRMSKSFSIKK